MPGGAHCARARWICPRARRHGPLRPSLPWHEPLPKQAQRPVVLPIAAMPRAPLPRAVIMDRLGWPELTLPPGAFGGHSTLTYAEGCTPILPPLFSTSLANWPPPPHNRELTLGRREDTGQSQGRCLLVSDRHHVSSNLRWCISRRHSPLILPQPLLYLIYHAFCQGIRTGIDNIYCSTTPSPSQRCKFSRMLTIALG